MKFEDIAKSSAEAAVGWSKVLASKQSILAKANQLREEVDGFVKITASLLRVDPAICEVCESAHSDGRKRSMSGDHLPPPSEFSTASSSLYSGLFVGALGVPLGVVGGIGSVVGSVFSATTKETPSDRGDRPPRADSSGQLFSPSRPSTSKSLVESNLESLRSAYHAFVTDWHEVMDLFDDIFQNYVQHVEEPSWGWNIVFSANDQNLLRQGLDALLMTVTTKCAGLRTSLAFLTSTGHTYLARKSEESQRMLEQENRYATARVWWRSKFGSETKVSLAQVIDAFGTESGLAQCDWGGAEDDINKFALVAKGAKDFIPAALENILLRRLLAMKWGAEAQTSGESNPLHIVGALKLNQFVGLVGSTGDKQFVREMTKELETFRDLFVSRIKFKLIRGIAEKANGPKRRSGKSGVVMMAGYHTVVLNPLESVILACSVPCFDSRFCALGDYIGIFRLTQSSAKALLPADVAHGHYAASGGSLAPGDALLYSEETSLRAFVNPLANELAYGPDPINWNVRLHGNQDSSSSRRFEMTPMTELDLTDLGVTEERHIFYAPLLVKPGLYFIRLCLVNGNYSSYGSSSRGKMPAQNQFLDLVRSNSKQLFVDGSANSSKFEDVDVLVSVGGIGLPSFKEFCVLMERFADIEMQTVRIELKKGNNFGRLKTITTRKSFFSNQVATTSFVCAKCKGLLFRQPDNFSAAAWSCDFPGHSDSKVNFGAGDIVFSCATGCDWRVCELCWEKLANCMECSSTMMRRPCMTHPWECDWVQHDLIARISREISLEDDDGKQIPLDEPVFGCLNSICCSYNVCRQCWVHRTNAAKRPLVGRKIHKAAVLVCGECNLPMMPLKPGAVPDSWKCSWPGHSVSSLRAASLAYGCSTADLCHWGICHSCWDDACKCVECALPLELCPPVEGSSATWICGWPLHAGNPICKDTDAKYGCSNSITCSYFVCKPCHNLMFNARPAPYADYLITGCTVLPTADKINGYYIPTVENIGGFKCYQKFDNPNIWMQYNLTGSIWHIRSSADQTVDNCLAYVRASPPCLPDEIEVENWFVMDGNGQWVEDISFQVSSVNELLASSSFFEDESANISDASAANSVSEAVAVDVPEVLSEDVFDEDIQSTEQNAVHQLPSVSIDAHKAQSQELSYSVEDTFELAASKKIANPRKKSLNVSVSFYLPNDDHDEDEAKEASKSESNNDTETDSKKDRSTSESRNNLLQSSVSFYLPNSENSQVVLSENVFEDFTTPRGNSSSFFDIPGELVSLELSSANKKLEVSPERRELLSTATSFYIPGHEQNSNLFCEDELEDVTSPRSTGSASSDKISSPNNESWSAVIADNSFPVHQNSASVFFESPDIASNNHEDNEHTSRGLLYLDTNETIDIPRDDEDERHLLNISAEIFDDELFPSLRSDSYYSARATQGDDEDEVTTSESFQRVEDVSQLEISKEKTSVPKISQSDTLFFGDIPHIPASDGQGQNYDDFNSPRGETPRTNFNSASSYLAAYSDIGEIPEIGGDPVSFPGMVIFGATGEHARKINGGYICTPERSFDLEVYQSKEDPNYWLLYRQYPAPSWQIQRAVGENTQLLAYACSDVCQPDELARPWIVHNGIFWEAQSQLVCVSETSHVYPIRVSNAVGDFADRINGIYIPNGDVADGEPVYYLDCGNSHTVMTYKNSSQRWEISNSEISTSVSKSSPDLVTGVLAYAGCSVPVHPERVGAVWIGCDKSGHWSLQDSLVITLASEPEPMILQVAREKQRAQPVMFTGISEEMVPVLKGLFIPTREKTLEYPIYQNHDNPDIWLTFWGKSLSWRISLTEDKYSANCIAFVTTSAAAYPDQIDGIWNVSSANGDWVPSYDLKLVKVPRTLFFPIYDSVKDRPPVKIAGVPGSMADIVNGFYLPTMELSGGVPVYEKLQNPDKWLIFRPKTRSWDVTRTVDKYTSFRYAYCPNSTALAPHHCAGEWHILQGTKFVVNPSVTAVGAPEIMETLLTSGVKSNSFYLPFWTKFSQESPLSVNSDTSGFGSSGKGKKVTSGDETKRLTSKKSTLTEHALEKHTKMMNTMPSELEIIPIQDDGVDFEEQLPEYQELPPYADEDEFTTPASVLADRMIQKHTLTVDNLFGDDLPSDFDESSGKVGPKLEREGLLLQSYQPSTSQCNMADGDSYCSVIKLSVSESDNDYLTLAVVCLLYPGTSLTQLQITSFLPASRLVIGNENLVQIPASDDSMVQRAGSALLGFGGTSRSAVLSFQLPVRSFEALFNSPIRFRFGGPQFSDAHLVVNRSVENELKDLLTQVKKTLVRIRSAGLAKIADAVVRVLVEEYVQSKQGSISNDKISDLVSLWSQFAEVQKLELSIDLEVLVSSVHVKLMESFQQWICNWGTSDSPASALNEIEVAACELRSLRQLARNLLPPSLAHALKVIRRTAEVERKLATAGSTFDWSTDAAKAAAESCTPALFAKYCKVRVGLLAVDAFESLTAGKFSHASDLVGKFFSLKTRSKEFLQVNSSQGNMQNSPSFVSCFDYSIAIPSRKSITQEIASLINEIEGLIQVRASNQRVCHVDNLAAVLKELASARRVLSKLSAAPPSFDSYVDLNAQQTLVYVVDQHSLAWGMLGTTGRVCNFDARRPTIASSQLPSSRKTTTEIYSKSSWRVRVDLTAPFCGDMRQVDVDVTETRINSAVMAIFYYLSDRQYADDGQPQGKPCRIAIVDNKNNVRMTVSIDSSLTMIEIDFSSLLAEDCTKFSKVTYFVRFVSSDCFSETVDLSMLYLEPCLRVTFILKFSLTSDASNHALDVSDYALCECEDCMNPGDAKCDRCQTTYCSAHYIALTHLCRATRRSSVRKSAILAASTKDSSFGWDDLYLQNNSFDGSPSAFRAPDMPEVDSVEESSPAEDPVETKAALRTALLRQPSGMNMVSSNLAISPLVTHTRVYFPPDGISEGEPSPKFNDDNPLLSSSSIPTSGRRHSHPLVTDTSSPQPASMRTQPVKDNADSITVSSRSVPPSRNASGRVGAARFLFQDDSTPSPIQVSGAQTDLMAHFGEPSATQVGSVSITESPAPSNRSGFNSALGTAAARPRALSTAGRGAASLSGRHTSQG